MLVVLGIAALIVPILLVSTSLLSQGFGEKQALSQVNAALSLARATAIRDGRDTALLFMADEDGTTILQIATMSSDPVMVLTDRRYPSMPQFVPVGDRSPDKLAEGICIVSPQSDINSSQYYVGPQLNPKQNKGNNHRFEADPAIDRNVDLVHFAVRFAPDGTIVRTNSDGTNAWFWFDHDNDNSFDINDNQNAGPKDPADPDDFVDDPTFQPVDILALYSKEQAEAYAVASDPEKLRDWINTPGPETNPNDNITPNEGKAFIILFNRYTGLALRSSN